MIRGDGKLNWVALRLDDSLETLDASTFQIRQRVSGDTEVIAISSDGGFLADERYLHGKDGAVVLELRDGHTLALIQKLASWTDGHSSKDAAFSPDGAVLTLRLEGELRGWDLRSGATMSAQAVQKLKASQPPNQNRLTIDNAVDWVRLGPHSSQVTFMSWEPNTGRWLTTSGDGSARIWDEHTGQSLSRIETMDGSAMAWSPDGSQVVGGCGVPPMPHNEEVHHDSGQHICIWNRAGDHKYALQDVDTRHFPTNPIVSLSFAPDGRTLAVVSEEGLKLWDIPNARLAKTLDVWVCGRDSYCSVPSQIEFDRDGTLWALRGGFLHWGADGSALPVPKLPEYPAPGDYWSNFSLSA